MKHLLPFPFEPEKTVVDDRFVIKSELGQGGMGRCYRVLQKNLDRICVLKMLAPKLHPRFVDHTDARVMLENEAKTLGLVANGNDSFVQVFDRGVIFALIRLDGQALELDLPYYVMEYLQGQSLEVIIDGAAARQHPLPIDSVVSLCHQASRALRIAHSRGVIHRDVKPDNMFLQERVDRLPTLKLIDFGVSTREGAAHVHGTGTIRYGAPELLSKRVSRASTQSDMYPLGLVFYELAALRGPHVCNSKEDYMWAHVYLEAPDVRQFRPECPPRFAGLIAALLAKDPASRPTAEQTDDELTAILASLAGGGSAQAQLSRLLPSPRERAARRERATRPSSERYHGATLSSTLPSSELGAVGQAAASSSQFFSSQPLVALPEPMPRASALREKTQPANSAAAMMKRDTVRGMDQPPIEGLPPMVVEEPTFHSHPIPGSNQADARPTDPTAGGAIEDVPYVPVFKSMGQIFDAVWDDDTRYQPSPFATVDIPLPALSASLARAAMVPDDRRAEDRFRGTPFDAVLSRRSVSMEDEFFSRGEPSSPPAQDDPPLRPARRIGRILIAVIGAASVGVALLVAVGLGVKRVSWGQETAVSQGVAVPTPSFVPAATAPPSPPVAVAASGSSNAAQQSSPTLPIVQPAPSSIAFHSR